MEQEKDFNRIKNPDRGSVHFQFIMRRTKNYDMITANACTIGIRTTQWPKQDNGKINSIPYGSEYSNVFETYYSIGGMQLLVVVWPLEKF